MGVSQSERRPVFPRRWGGRGPRLLGYALLVAAAFWACSSSSVGAAAPGSSCTTNPANCPTGTTCWPADSVPNLRCLASNPAGGFGASCDQSIGKATCADGLACDQTGPSPGSCTYYCGASGTATCPTGYECRDTHIGGANGASVDICRPAALPAGDAGLFEAGPYPDAPFMVSDDAGDVRASDSPAHQ